MSVKGKKAAAAAADSDSADPLNGEKVKRDISHLTTKRHGGSSRKDSKVTKPSIRRLARRGGVMRMSDKVYKEARAVIDYWLDKSVRDAIMLCVHSHRKTVSVADAKVALKKNGRILYM